MPIHLSSRGLLTVHTLLAVALALVIVHALSTRMIHARVCHGALPPSFLHAKANMVRITQSQLHHVRPALDRSIALEMRLVVKHLAKVALPAAIPAIQRRKPRASYRDAR